MKKFFEEFKEFIQQGNVMDMAIGIIIGGAFTAIVTSLVNDIINRYKAMRGFQTPYIPGWDCHGQPIEHKVEEMLGTEKFNALPTEKSLDKISIPHLLSCLIRRK